MTIVPFADCFRKLSVEVQINRTSNVFLVNSENYRKLQHGEHFEYHGGYYRPGSVNITVMDAERWFLIVMGDNNYKYTFYEADQIQNIG